MSSHQQPKENVELTSPLLLNDHHQNGNDPTLPALLTESDTRSVTPKG